MSLLRMALLAASQNRWMREHATRYKFVRRSVSRFMPGEALDDALGAAESLKERKIGATLTHLGENVADRGEAQQVAEHYVEVLQRIRTQGLNTEISIKLTQLGLDLSDELCFDLLKSIVANERADSTVWIDMEASNYVDRTIAIYRRALESFPNVGLCLQAYLYRTAKDVEDLLTMRPSIRLVKGAYREPKEVAIPLKRDVDKSYVELAQRLLSAQQEGRCRRAALATHDAALIGKITEFAEKAGTPRSKVEVQMLYGIQRAEQERLAEAGHRVMVLVSYGSYWYPWFVRRLAERPANLWFMLRNVFAS